MADFTARSSGSNHRPGRRRLIGAILAGAILSLSACSDDGQELASPTAVASAASDSSTPMPMGITVVGRGEVLGSPDTTTVVVGVRVTRETVAESSADASTRVDAMVSALEAAGVNRSDIQTENLWIQPEYNYSDQGSVLIGFTVSNTMRVTIRDVEGAGAIIDAAVSAGGDEAVVDSVGFGLVDNAERLAEARDRAWADAVAKAEQLAGLADRSLGEVVTITESLAGAGGEVFYGGGEGDMGGMPSGQVSTVVTITVVYSIS